jgi:hypothetical protein
MTIKYKKTKDGDTGEIRDDQISLINTDTPNLITYIPVNLENIDYQEYLEWVEEGNTPEPADE